MYVAVKGNLSSSRMGLPRAPDAPSALLSSAVHKLWAGLGLQQELRLVASGSRAVHSDSRCTPPITTTTSSSSSSNTTLAPVSLAEIHPAGLRPPQQAHLSCNKACYEQDRPIRCGAGVTPSLMYNH